MYECVSLLLAGKKIINVFPLSVFFTDVIRLIESPRSHEETNRVMLSRESDTKMLATG